MKSLLVLLLGIFPLVSEARWKFAGNIAPYFQDIMVGTQAKYPSEKSGVSAEFQFEKDVNSHLRVKAQGWIRTDALARDSEETFQYIPKNVYLQSRKKKTTVKLGYQTLAVDGPDLVNPADVVHAKNWVDPTAPVALSSLGASLTQDIGGVSIDLLYVPRQTTLVLPGAHSPWLPRRNRLPIESEDTEIRIPNDVEYQYRTGKEVGDALDHNLTLRLSQRSEFLETQFLFYEGLSHSPFVLTELSGTLVSTSPYVIRVDSPVKLIPLYYRHRVLAGTFNLPFESWAIHGGANWMKPLGNDDRLPRETALFVLGGEKSFETPLGVVTILIDYVRQERQDKEQISFLRSIFDEAMVLGSRIPLGEEAQILAGGILNLRGSGSVVKLGGTRRLGASLSLEADAQFIQGSEESLLGLYGDHDTYQLRLVWAW